MSAIEPNTSSSARLVSVDVFRGATIVGMILVNNPGNWGAVYAPLLHAEWHGWTPTDLIFPFFLFIVGVAIVLALGRRLEAGADRTRLAVKAAKRSLVLLGLGLFLSGYPFALFGPRSFERLLETWRFPGVLQRIALCYLAASLLFIFLFRARQPSAPPRSGRAPSRPSSPSSSPPPSPLAGAAKTVDTGVDRYRPGRRTLKLWIVGLLLGYWALLTLVPVPGVEVPDLASKGDHLAGWVDRVVFGQHVWSQAKVYDPEGLLSTLPALATTLFGVLAGLTLVSRRKPFEKLTRLFVHGSGLVVLGYVWAWFFPINKPLWTSSYAVFTAGVATCALALSYYLFDLHDRRALARPLTLYGINAITVFVGSGVLAKTLIYLKVGDESLQGWLYARFFASWLPPHPASLAWALAWILGWFLVLAWMARRGVVLKV